MKLRTPTVPFEEKHGRLATISSARRLKTLMMAMGWKQRASRAWPGGGRILHPDVFQQCPLTQAVPVLQGNELPLTFQSFLRGLGGPAQVSPGPPQTPEASAVRGECKMSPFAQGRLSCCLPLPLPLPLKGSCCTSTIKQLMATQGAEAFPHLPVGQVSLAQRGNEVGGGGLTSMGEDEMG